MTRVVSLFLLAVAAVATGLGAQAPATPGRAPHVVFVTGDDEYRSEISMPMIAGEIQADATQ